jgi:hypothetical protein
MKKPKIICLCGSSRFIELFAVAAWVLERDEKAVVLGPHYLPYELPNYLAEHEGIADQTDDLQMHKIDMADEIFVINWGNYIGDSTRKETKHAYETGKNIRVLTMDNTGLKIIDLLDEQTEFSLRDYFDDKVPVNVPVNVEAMTIVYAKNIRFRRTE